MVELGYLLHTLPEAISKLWVLVYGTCQNLHKSEAILIHIIGQIQAAYFPLSDNLFNSVLADLLSQQRIVLLFVAYLQTFRCTGKSSRCSPTAEAKTLYTKYVAR
jgi:hypothetical protein